MSGSADHPDDRASGRPSAAPAQGQTPHVPPPRTLSALQPPPHHHPLRHDLPASRPDRTVVLRGPRRVVRGLSPAVYRPGSHRASGSGRGALRVRDRERPRRPGAGLVQRGLTGRSEPRRALPAGVPATPNSPTPPPTTHSLTRTDR